MTRQESQAVFDKLCEVIPGGVNSPVRSFPGLNQTPLVLEGAKGDLLFDVDGNEYIDFCCSWGAVILGHSPDHVVDALERQIRRGTTFGVTTRQEEELARLVCKMIPSIEQVRFVSSGTEATMSAIRVARGFTGRDVVVKFTGCYHGHADYLLVQAGSGVTQLGATSSSAGVPAELVRSTISLPYNDVRCVKQLFADRGDQIAAVIVEPVAGNMGVVPGTMEFLQTLRDETQKAGSLLIFDEVITGFRVGPAGYQGRIGITPDLTCLSKIAGGGFPVGAFGGSQEIMSVLAPLGPVYQAGTLAGNPVAAVAATKTLSHLNHPEVYDELEEKTAQFLQPIEEAIGDKPMCIQRVGSMFTLFFGKRKVANQADAKACDGELFNSFFRHMFDRGVYIPPSQFEAWFIGMAHTKAHLSKAQTDVLDFINEHV